MNYYTFILSIMLIGFIAAVVSLARYAGRMRKRALILFEMVLRCSVGADRLGDLVNDLGNDVVSAEKMRQGVRKLQTALTAVCLQAQEIKNQIF